MKRDMEHLNLQDAFRPMPEETRDALINAACSVKEEEIVKKKLTFSFVSVIAILLALVAVAYAATEVYHRITVNWKGETVEETVLPVCPEPTVVPPRDAQTLNLNDEDLSRMADELLNTVAEDEYGLASYESNGATMSRLSPIQKSFDSWDKFREYMIHLSELTLPTWIPDGYEFREAKVMLFCKADGEYKMIEERQEGAVTLKRYKIDDPDSVVGWYIIDYREFGKDNHYLIVGSSLTDDLDGDGRTFNLTDGQSASVMTIPGMDNALAIVDSNDPTYNRLAMIRRLDRPVEYRMGPVYDDQHTPAESTVSTYESIDVSSPWLDIESLKRMFTPGE